jgi:hypothetical protein
MHIMINKKLLANNIVKDWGIAPWLQVDDTMHITYNKEIYLFTFPLNGLKVGTNICLKQDQFVNLINYFQKLQDGTHIRNLAHMHEYI